jgi:hypothetical protein
MCWKRKFVAVRAKSVARDTGSSAVLSQSARVRTQRSTATPCGRPGLTRSDFGRPTAADPNRATVHPSRVRDGEGSFRSHLCGRL